MLLFTARVVVVVVVGVSSSANLERRSLSAAISSALSCDGGFAINEAMTLLFADMGDGEDEETEEVVQEEDEVAEEVAEELELDWSSACFFFESGGIWSDSNVIKLRYG